MYLYISYLHKDSARIGHRYTERNPCGGDRGNWNHSALPSIPVTLTYRHQSGGPLVFNLVICYNLWSACDRLTQSKKLEDLTVQNIFYMLEMCHILLVSLVRASQVGTSHLIFQVTSVWSALREGSCEYIPY